MMMRCERRFRRSQKRCTRWNPMGHVKDCIWRERPMKDLWKFFFNFRNNMIKFVFLNTSPWLQYEKWITKKQERLKPATPKAASVALTNETRDIIKRNKTLLMTRKGETNREMLRSHSFQYGWVQDWYWCWQRPGWAIEYLENGKIIRSCPETQRTWVCYCKRI